MIDDDVVTCTCTFNILKKWRDVTRTNKIQKKIDHAAPVWRYRLFQKGENKKSKTKWSEAWVIKDVPVQ